jgi:hypothetical protein
MNIYFKNIILFVSFYCCLVLSIKANDVKNDSSVKYKNEIEIGIGGAANIFKTSYIRNIHLSDKWIIAPRIGLSTLGVDFKFNIGKRFLFCFGTRLLALKYIPYGIPIPFESKYYVRYEDGEFNCLICSLAASNFIGLNYLINKFTLGMNISVNSLLYDRSETYSNDVLSMGITMGYKFNFSKN